MCGLPSGTAGSNRERRQNGRRAAGASRAPPDDLIPDRVERTRGPQPADSAPPSTLEKRRGLGPAARGVAARGPGYPAVSPGISGDRERALRWQREEVSPGRGEIGVG
jgi:hypothetical protein